MSFWFGDFELDQERRQLLRSGEPVPLEPKAYELLGLLLERRPRALSKAQIRDVIWPQTFITESTLAVVVNGIRQALEDDARHPRFIRTVHGFGYAFCGEARQTADEHPGTGDAYPEAGGAPRAEISESAPPEPKQEASVEGSPARRGAAKAGRWRWTVAAAAALAVLSAGWYWFGARRTTAPDESPTAVPLTSLPGVELDPALSPDGGRVAFIWDGPDRSNFDVYVKEIASGETVRVTSDPAADHHPVWSPDGKRLAFLRRQGTGARVILVPAGGGEERELAPISELPRLYLQDLWSFCLDWSPDGRFLAVSDRGADGQSWGVYLISLGTGEKRELTTTGNPRIIDRLPAFSPDGRTLAFLRGSFAPEAELLVQPLTSDATPAAPAKAVVKERVAGANRISWVAGGRELVVGDWRISLSGSRSRPFRLPGRGDPDPSGGRVQERISIRGTRLVFSTPESRLQLFRVSLTGASRAHLAPFQPSTRGENHPAFSPDGRRVAFTSRRSGDGLIWVCTVDGSSCHSLPRPRGSFYASSPSWSPDGRRLAFDAGVGEAFHVYIAPAEGGTIRPLTSSRPPAAGTSRSGRCEPMRRMPTPLRSGSPGTAASRRRSHRTAGTCTTPNAAHPGSGACLWTGREPLARRGSSKSAARDAGSCARVGSSSWPEGSGFLRRSASSTSPRGARPRCWPCRQTGTSSSTAAHSRCRRTGSGPSSTSSGSSRATSCWSRDSGDARAGSLAGRPCDGLLLIVCQN